VSANDVQRTERQRRLDALNLDNGEIPTRTVSK
jgi:hypothetical protein